MHEKCIWYLMSPHFPSAAGAGVSQEKNTNLLFQAQAFKICALGDGSLGM